MWGTKFRIDRAGENPMICYCDGLLVTLGDSVDFDGEAARVIEIFQTVEQANAAGLPEPMVGFETYSLGSVYQSPTDRGWDGIKLRAR